MRADAPEDRALIEAARDVIRRTYDAVHENHTVGAAVRAGSGRIYLGVNVYNLHGSCAEYIAVGAAITAGEREITGVAAVRGPDGAELLSPCGNCRQMLAGYFPEAGVIVPGDGGPVKIRASELLPHAYQTLPHTYHVDEACDPRSADDAEK